MHSLRNLSLTLSTLALAAAGMTATVSAQAQSSYSMSTPGTGYLGLNIGKSDFSLGNGSNLFPSDNKDTVYSLYAGRYFNPNLGLELGYTDFGRISRGGGTTRANGFNLSLVGKLPLNDSFNLLGKVGTTYSRTDTSSLPFSGVASGNESGFGVSYGIGAEYAFNPQLSAVVQYDSHNLKFAGSGSERVGATTVGLRYRF